MKRNTVLVALALCFLSAEVLAVENPIGITEKHIRKMIDFERDVIAMGQSLSGLDTNIIQSLMGVAQSVQCELSQVKAMLKMYSLVTTEENQTKARSDIVEQVSFMCTSLDLQLNTLNHNLAYTERQGMIHIISEMKDYLRNMKPDYNCD